MDSALAKSLLSSVNWKVLFEPAGDDVQMLWDTFSQVMEDIFTVTVPFKCNVPGRKVATYPKVIRKKMQKKRSLFHRWKQTGSQTDKEAYRASCFDCTAEIRALRAAREKEVLSSNSASRFYAYVQQRLSTRTGVAPLKAAGGGVVVADDHKAAALQDQFSSVFTLDNGRLPTVATQLSPSPIDTFRISTEDVRRVLCKSLLKYGPTPDGIPLAILRLLSFELAVPLQIIFTASLSTGELPNCWKTAVITPIFKKGDPSEVANYCPVSITASTSRKYEQVFWLFVMWHLRKQGLFSDCQWGALKGRSTELQLLHCLNRWTKALDQGLFTDVVLLDFAKAFDTVSHPKLLHKLEHTYGISGQMLRWIRAFLSGRTQQVKVGSALSQPCQVTSGVPQGTVSGAFLFLLYINDLADCIDPSVGLSMFVDDTKLDLQWDKPEERALLQKNVDSFSGWSDDSQLVVQPAKSASLCIGRAPAPNYTINGEPLVTVSLIRDLGVHLDSSLNFKVHVATITRKALAGLCVLFKCFVTSDVEALLRAYASFVRPLLEYASIVWSPSLSRRSSLGCLSSVDRIEAVQRSFTRRLFVQCRLPMGTSYLERLRVLNLEPLQLRRLKADLCMVYKMWHGLVHIGGCFSDYFSCSDSRIRGHCHRLRSHFCHSDTRLNFFCIRVVPWNALPEFVVSSSSYSIFKIRLCSCYDILLSFCTFARNL